MPRLSNPLIDRKSPERRPRRAAYALPTLFTAGNIFLGYLSILRSFRGAMTAAMGGAGAAEQFETAAKAIGIAVLLDGLDGLIARVTHTTSDFGREMDSLADVISFGMAPAVLAFAWGVQFVDSGLSQQFQRQLFQAGYFVAFLFLICGAARLARFNVQKNPIPKNPGRPNRKYFVGLPIPGAAGTVAAAVYAFDSEPIHYWPIAVVWLALLALLGFLMVSTWRYYSFKGLHLRQPHTPLIVILVSGLVYAIWNYGHLVLPMMAAAYVGSGIAIRAGGIIRRRVLHRGLSAPPSAPEHQIG
ncbi:MAG TPA: CDP-diacylglycerol--serine O-phosphatidyltransferase [Bryobacteraceae bacterium]|nr:CDP-diacylglycerol--serine O-phosphatidyltransferase [Bryobacteraceae bacterium]